MIDQCFVQLKWCPTIAQDRAYFCEVANGIDRLFELDAGWKLDYDWFMKCPGDFNDQISSYCHMCGMALPMERQMLCNSRELVTPNLLDLMKSKKLNRTSDKHVEIFDKQFTYDEIKENLKTWDPRNFRGLNDNPARYGIVI